MPTICWPAAARSHRTNAARTQSHRGDVRRDRSRSPRDEFAGDDDDLVIGNAAGQQSRQAPAVASRTASGSVGVPGTGARVARASRIYVEGRHDAELIAQVWGEDLRIEGVVVEYLGGVDDLVGIVAEFAPGTGRRLGVLVDHLVAGSKEARIAEAVRRGPGGPDSLVVGHPYVD